MYNRCLEEEKNIIHVMEFYAIKKANFLMQTEYKFSLFSIFVHAYLY